VNVILQSSQTLDRPCKKGLLNRQKNERAFFYTPVSRDAYWAQRRSGNFLAGPRLSTALLISSVVDAVGADEALLNELERKIKRKRKELSQRENP